VDRRRDCTLVFQNLRLTEEALRQLYRGSDYFGLLMGSACGGYVDYVSDDPMRIAQSRRRLARIANVAGSRGGRLLDIASASRLTTQALRSPASSRTPLVAYGRERYGLAFTIATLQACPLERGRCDVVTLWGAESYLLHPLHSFEKLGARSSPAASLP
jgi:hypothetical protein